MQHGMIGGRHTDDCGAQGVGEDPYLGPRGRGRRRGAAEARWAGRLGR